jgi:hypothetical protein
MTGDDVQELLTGLALRQLAERYALAVDRRDAELFAAQFTENGVLEAPRGRFVGREALQTVIPMLRERYARTFHAVLGQVPEFSGSRATAETYSIARHFFRDEVGRSACYEMTIRYQDTFEHTDQGWLFSRRELVVDATRTFLVDDRPR